MSVPVRLLQIGLHHLRVGWDGHCRLAGTGGGYNHLEVGVVSVQRLHEAVQALVLSVRGVFQGVSPSGQHLHGHLNVSQCLGEGRRGEGRE